MNKLIRSLTMAAALSLPTGALADIAASDCDWLQDMRVIAEPWEKHTRTFNEGEVRVVLGDSVEPACCYLHVIVLLPDPDDELGGRKCVVINQGSTMGFSKVDWDALKASHDPATGLTITFPYANYDAENASAGPTKAATVRIDLSTGDVTAR